MRRLMICALFIPALFAVWAASPTSAAAQGIQGLRCENATNPRGIKTPNPQLSWTLGPTQQQYAYQVIVASSEEKLEADEGDIWDSGEVISDHNTAQFQGKALSSFQHYYWKVRVWDHTNYHMSGYSGPASWDMGVLFLNNRGEK
jgi:alpha-L-rhamnosidase